MYFVHLFAIFATKCTKIVTFPRVDTHYSEIWHIFVVHQHSKDMKQAMQVKQFHQTFGLPVREKPTLIPIQEFELRMSLLREALAEMEEAYYSADMVGVADAIIDEMYFLLEAAVIFGITDKMEALFDEVHSSNMSKLDENG